MRESLYGSMEAIEHRHWWFVAKRRIIRALIDRYAPAPAGGGKPRLIDIGCGTGGLLDETRDRFEAIGLDSAARAREACERRGHRVRPCWLPGDLPVEPASADVCVMSDVLEHVEDDRGSVLAAAARLREGGILICTVPAHPWLWTARDAAHEHKRRYTRRGYEALFEGSGLREEFTGWYMAWLMPLLLGERMVLKLLGDPDFDDVRMLPGPVNALLRAVFGLERFTLGRIPFPFGGSLISVHRRTAGPIASASVPP